MERSRECYEQAIALDPRFMAPYAALAMFYHIVASTFMDPREAVARGRENANKALELDPSLPEAHAWLGIFAVVYDLNWEEAAGDFNWQWRMSRWLR